MWHIANKWNRNSNKNTKQHCVQRDMFFARKNIVYYL